VVGPVFTSADDWPTQICAGDYGCNSRLNAVVSNTEEARTKVREYAAAGVDALKLVYDDIIVPGVRLDDDIVAAIADEAHAHDLRLLAHMSSADIPASRLIDLGVDGFVHSNMDLSGAVQKMRDNNIPVISTATAALEQDERLRVSDPAFEADYAEYFDASLANVRTLVDQGVVVAFGTDAVAGPPGMSSGFLGTTSSGEGLFLAEARALGRVLTNEEIVMLLTSNAAKFLGMDARIGSLESGKLADIVMIDGDPLEDISDLERVRVVIQGGRVVVDRR
jgi:imidazolonepropionase-like amidohydrolase